MGQHEHIKQLADHLFRHESGKMIAVLSRILGIQQLETAQDIVQDTLLQAMTTWGFKGLPENPAAWLMKAARNKAIDLLRRQKRFNQISPEYAYLLRSGQSLEPALHELFLDREIGDSQLRMIFACCHPAIPEESQIALTLKTLCGLSAAEIARAFLTSEETVAKRIYRAREKIRMASIELHVPAGHELSPRTDAVLKTLYLLFNEGYNSSHPEHLIREDLCHEAMRLCHLLTEHRLTGYPRVKALLSLMCFQASRLDARLDDKGNIILLKYQDRSKWYRPLIQKGFEYLDASAEPFEESPYQLEAAIASLHAAAPSFEATDWNRIYQLYEMLLKMQQSPVVALNKAIAAAYAFSPAQALGDLLNLEGLESYHIYYASIGELLMDQGRKAEARPYFEKALTLAPSQAEQQLLTNRLAACG